MQKNLFMRNVSLLSGILIMSVIFLGVSCKTSQQAFEIKASDFNPPSANAIQFKIARADLEKAYRYKQQQKLILEVEVNTTGSAPTYILYAYLAKNHRDYARRVAGSDGPTFTAIQEPGKNEFPQKFVTSNCEIPLRSVLFDSQGKPQTYNFLIFRPTTKITTNHLAFKVEADTDTQAAKAFRDDVFAIPCPPGRPSGDEEWLDR
jgi:hypothetical protein